MILNKDASPTCLKTRRISTSDHPRQAALLPPPKKARISFCFSSNPELPTPPFCRVRPLRWVVTSVAIIRTTSGGSVWSGRWSRGGGSEGVDEGGRGPVGCVSIKVVES